MFAFITVFLKWLSTKCLDTIKLPIIFEKLLFYAIFLRVGNFSFLTTISCDRTLSAKVFPNKPHSSATVQYNNAYIFNKLGKVNSLRNSITHHEPIYFRLHAVEIDTSYIVNESKPNVKIYIK